MSDAPEVDPRDPLEALRDAWVAESDTRFDQWLRMVSEAFLASSLELQPAARLLDTTAAELDAALRLATLEDETLAVLAAGVPPPRTTWYVLAGASLTGVRAGLAAPRDLGGRRTGFGRSRACRPNCRGAQPLGARRRAWWTSSWAHGSKGQEVRPPATKISKFLVDIAIRRSGGKTLTEKQAAYALNVLTRYSWKAVRSARQHRWRPRHLRRSASSARTRCLVMAVGTNGLRELGLEIHYEGPGDELLQGFVLPALGVATSYDRLTGFFTTNP